MIKEIYDEKLNIDTTKMDEERSILITTKENIKTEELFSEYDYFNKKLSKDIKSNIKLEYLYNILSLGNNTYLLQF